MRLQGLVDAWNNRSAEEVAARFATDGVRRQLAHPEATLDGHQAIAEGVGAILHACPDASLEVRAEVVGDAGRVTLEWTFTGTLTNELQGLPASGGTVRLPGVSVITLNSDDLIVEERVYWDGATLMVAAGLIE